MNTTFTRPTTISQEQYAEAYFAIDAETADHYLVYNDEDGEQALWVGRDEDSLSNSLECELKEVQVSGESGDWTGIEAYCFPTSESWNDLDLEALEEGRLRWR